MPNPNALARKQHWKWFFFFFYITYYVSVLFIEHLFDWHCRELTYWLKRTSPQVSLHTSTNPGLERSPVPLRRSTPGLQVGLWKRGNTPYQWFLFISIRQTLNKKEELKPLGFSVKYIWSGVDHLFSLNHIRSAPMANICIVDIATMNRSSWYQDISAQTSVEDELQTFKGPINVHWTITMPFITSTSSSLPLSLCCWGQTMGCFCKWVWGVSAGHKWRR